MPRKFAEYVGETITIDRGGATQTEARNKWRIAQILFVTARVPRIRQVTQNIGALPDSPKWMAHELDFYLRNAQTGDVLLNANGKDRIDEQKLDAAVEKLIVGYFNEVVRGAREQQNAQQAIEAARTAAIGDEE